MVVSRTIISGLVVASASLNMSCKHGSNISSEPSEFNVIQEITRRDAFNPSDIKTLSVVASSSDFEPWEVGVMYLVGEFPDGSKARISKKVEWALGSDYGTQVILDTTNGRISSAVPGVFKVVARWQDNEVARNVVVKPRSIPVYNLLNDPTQFTAEAVEGTAVKLQWNAAPGVYAGYVIAYSDKGLAPPSCDPPMAGDNSYLVTKTIVGREHELPGLVAGATYYFRLCSLQEVAFTDKKLSRLSLGVVQSLQLASE